MTGINATLLIEEGGFSNAHCEDASQETGTDLNPAAIAALLQL